MLRLRRKRSLQIECGEILRTNKQDDVPLSDVASVESTLVEDLPSRFCQAFDPAPIIPQSAVLGFGVLIYFLVMIWPPLILLVAYIFSKLIPYSFRENDEASSRRQLFHEFMKEDDLPENFKAIPDHICLEEQFIVNDR
jgi:hypothetical protein